MLYLKQKDYCPVECNIYFYQKFILSNFHNFINNNYMFAHYYYCYYYYYYYYTIIILLYY